MIDPRLEALGLTADLIAGLAAADIPRLARIVSVQRTGLSVNDGTVTREVPMAGRWFKPGREERPTVGDWVMLQADRLSVDVLLPRRNLLRRRQADGVDAQPIAANVDTLFIVTACNNEFNPSRLERYLLVAEDARVQPVIVLTKPDSVAEPRRFIDEVGQIAPDVPVYAVDARDPEAVSVLRAWCGPGRTLVLLGSSGVGKSTLLNSLAGAERQKTGAAREADDKGRHTTSHRSLHALPDGTLIIDSPGIRELGLTEEQADPAATFGDVEAIARQCRFRDCRHEQEPGCAVLAAVTRGELEPRRLQNWHRIRAEQTGAREAALSAKPRDGVSREGSTRDGPSRERTRRKGKLARRPAK